MQQTKCIQSTNEHIKSSIIMSSKVANSSDCINVQPNDEAPINEITLDEERNNISIMIQPGANISTISNSIKILIDKANKEMNRDWEGELQFNVFSHLNEELSIKNCIQFASHKNLLTKWLRNYKEWLEKKNQRQ